MVAFLAVCSLLFLILGVESTAEYTVLATETDSNTNYTTNCDNCHSLNYYVAHTEAYFTTETSFFFSPGTHYLNTSATIRDAHQLILQGDSMETSVITCAHLPAGLAFVNVSSLHLERLVFTECGMKFVFTPAVGEFSYSFLNISTALRASLFLNYVTNLSMLNVSVWNTGAGYGLFGVNLLGDSLINNVHFSKNNFDTLNDPQCLNFPTISCKGGNFLVIFTDTNDCPQSPTNHTLLISNSIFEYGADLGPVFHPFQTYSDSNDAEYIAGAGVGVILSQSTYGVHVTMEFDTFSNNTAYIGANLYLSVYDFVDNSSIVVRDSMILNGNNVEDVLSAAATFVIASGIYFYFGQLPPHPYTFPCPYSQDRHQKDLLQVVDCEISYNEATLAPAAVLYLWPKSNVDFTRRVLIDHVNISNNNGKSILSIFDPAYTPTGLPFEILFHEVHFVNNSRNLQIDNNADSYLIHILFINSVKSLLLSNCSFVNNRASSIRSQQSRIYFQGTNQFFNNAGTNGAAINLAEGSVMYMDEDTIIQFENNHASELGGAIYAEMFNYKCFFQLLPTDPYKELSQRLIFANNTAGSAGDAVYGNTQQCLLEDAAHFSTSSATFNQIVTILDDRESKTVISSTAYILCPCDHGTQEINCAQTLTKLVFPGENFTLPVAAIGYTAGFGQGLTPAIIHAGFDSQSNARLNHDQATSEIESGCSLLEYTIYSQPEQLSMVIFPQTDRTFIPLIVGIEVQPCPAGFVLSLAAPYYCECDLFLSTNNVTCDINSQTVNRDAGMWIGNSSLSSPPSLALSDCSSLFCLDYSIALDLSTPDAQCQNNHSGTQCGGCQQNFSLAIGSSNCLQCSNWYLFLLLVFAVAGILLIFLLSAFNLTVANGGINALLFYANIVRVSNYDSFNVRPSYFLPFSVFISWLNLDFGIETCFYNGYDNYAKAWFQYLFPLYLFLLMGAAVFLVQRSKILSHILPRNTTSVFSTLMLITFTKVLRTSILALPYSEILASDNKVHLGWYSDANESYLGAKIVPLVVFALLVLLFLILPYTVIMVAYPFLQKSSAREGTTADKLLNIFKQQLFKVKPFLDAYDAPFKENCRYWTGMLLVLRVVVYFAVVATYGVNSSNLYHPLVVITIAIVLLGMVLTMKVYTKKSNRLYECFFLINLALLEFVVLFVNLSDGSADISTIALCISIACSFAIFLSIIGQEIYIRCEDRLSKPKWRAIFLLCKLKNRKENKAEIATSEDDDMYTVDYLDHHHSLTSSSTEYTF